MFLLFVKANNILQKYLNWNIIQIPFYSGTGSLFDIFSFAL